ncbi:MAG: NAD(P)-dependent oxidoreductase [Roseburia sp.]|nr:NAD(P)-dependent oxidoreductase [Roseburia sp.]
MKVVVTGATSFLGSTLVKKLLMGGQFVYAVIRPDSKNRKELPEKMKNLVIIECDLKNMDQIDEKIPERCDYFFHLGWGGSGSANRKEINLQKQNVDNSVKALTGAMKLGCRRFLFSGSQAEYGQYNRLKAEEDICEPVSEYGKAKREFYFCASRMCKEWRERGIADIKYIHTRIFSVYGFGDHPWSLVQTCLKTFLEGGHIDLGACTQKWNFLYIDDLAEGLMALMFCSGLLREDGIYNVAGTESQTIPLRGYVEEMYRLCGEKGSYEYGKRPPNAEGLVNLIPDTTRIRTDTGWVPKISFDEGIRRMIEKM